jgi:hypothetical protein
MNWHICQCTDVQAVLGKSRVVLDSIQPCFSHLFDASSIKYLKTECDGLICAWVHGLACACVCVCVSFPSPSSHDYHTQNQKCYIILIFSLEIYTLTSNFADITLREPCSIVSETYFLFWRSHSELSDVSGSAFIDAGSWTDIVQCISKEYDRNKRALKKNWQFSVWECKYN